MTTSDSAPPDDADDAADEIAPVSAHVYGVATLLGLAVLFVACVLALLFLTPLP